MPWTYPDGLHPELRRPLVEPVGWAELAPLVCERLARGWTQGQLSAAMGVYRERISAAERGRLPAISPRFRRRYHEGLLRLRQAEERLQAAEAGES